MFNTTDISDFAVVFEDSISDASILNFNTYEEINDFFTDSIKRYFYLDK